MDKLLGSKWPNVAVMGAENERSELFLSKVVMLHQFALHQAA